MQILHLGDGLGQCAVRASGVLRKGGVIIYPTDTLYGLGADAFSDAAVAKVYDIKGRDTQKPMHCIVANLEMVAEYAEVNDAARKLAEKFLPGPLTLVLKKRPVLNTGIAKGIDTIGIRIPDNEFCVELAKSFGRPYTTTSANRAGTIPEVTLEKIVQQLGVSAKGVELAVDAGMLPLRSPSTVVNVVSGSPSILREGAIPAADILSA
jgi:L-threonylcarbamoyladenylate synthase